MSADVVERDERAIAVENASYRWGYLVLSFGLLVSVMARSYLFEDPSWDLMGLVVAGGLVCAAYQWWHQTLGRRAAYAGLIVTLLAAAIAAAVALLRAGR